MVEVDAQHAVEVAAVEDQQPVQTFGAHGSDEALRDGVRLRRANRRLYDADAFDAEDLVEGAAVPALAVADQEGDGRDRRARGRGAGLLSDPDAGWIGGAAGEPNAPTAMADEEERVAAALEHALDMQVNRSRQGRPLDRSDRRRGRRRRRCFIPGRERGSIRWSRSKRLWGGLTRFPRGWAGSDESCAP